MNSNSYFAAVLVAGLLAGVSASSVAAQSEGREPIRLAQSSDYLPPATRRYDSPPSPPSGGYDSPQRITPGRRGDQLPPPAPPPPYQGDSGGGGYGREAAAPGDLPQHRGPDYAAPPPAYQDNTYSDDEIIDAGHRFFGGVSKGLAKVVEYTFAKQGRPNGYILGEEAGGAIVAGLRYGNGRLFTKGLGTHQVYWQGPSLGYDFGAEGSKTLILVYNLLDAGQIYNRFAGVDGSAYLVGGVGVTFQTYDDVVLAPIRSGVGLRLGANVGYLKYTRAPTWNPF
jgi:hypothetical protein